MASVPRPVNRKGPSHFRNYGGERAPAIETVRDTFPRRG